MTRLAQASLASVKPGGSANHATRLTTAIAAAHSRTNSSRDLKQVCTKFGVTVKIPVSHVRLPISGKMSYMHAVLRPSSWFKVMLNHDKYSKLLLAGSKANQSNRWQQAFTDFWQKYASFDSGHPVFWDHAEWLDRCVPIKIHGDEGRGTGRSNVMVVSFQPVLVQYNVSKSSYWTRFLYSLVSSKIYREDATVDQLFEHLARDLRSLYFTGVKIESLGVTVYPVVIGNKGDWPYLAKSFCLKRWFKCKLICHKCSMTSKGSMVEIVSPAGGDLTDQDLYKVRSKRPLAQVPGLDRADMAKTDLAHTFHLGVGKHFCASTVMAMCKIGVFGTGNIRKLLNEAYQDCKDFCREGRHTISLCNFTLENFHANKRSYPHVGGKGSDTVILLRWLMHKLNYILTVTPDLYPSPSGDVMKLALAAARLADQFVETLIVEFRVSVWLSKAVARKCVEAGSKFVHLYYKLAQVSFKKEWLLYGLRPKLHMMVHMIDDLHSFVQDEAAAWTMNPISDFCFMDEDFIGKISRLSRRCHKLTCTKETISRYLVECYMQWSVIVS